MEIKIPIGAAVYGREEINAVDEILCNHKRLSMGEKVEEFERELAKTVGTRYAVAVNSGSSAAYLLHRPISMVSRRMPAICWPTVYWALGPWAIGPSTVDINYQFQPKGPVDIAVDILGIPSRCAGIVDACESLGTEGLDSVTAIHSFFSSHIITTMGEGGAVTTNDKGIAAVVRSLREFGRSLASKHLMRRYEFQRPGCSMKMTEPQAAFGIEQLKRLRIFLYLRRKNAWLYYRGIADEFQYPLIYRQLNEAAWFMYPIRVKDKTRAANTLLKHGIEVRPLLWLADEKCTTAKDMYDHTLCLPCHQALSDKQVSEVIRVVNNHL